MADYGFVTYDPKSNRKTGIVNSKYPIFGPRYDKIKTQFRTLHFVDTYSQPIETSSIGTPPRGNDWEVTTTQFHGYHKTLIKKIEHGGNGRIPTGYVTTFGSITKNTRSTLQFTKAVDSEGRFVDPFTLESSSTVTFSAASSVGEGLIDIGNQSSFSSFAQNYVPYQNIPQDFPDILIGFFTQIIPGDNSSEHDREWTVRVPYTIEIDDKYIYFYRWTFWCDIYSRLCVSNIIDVRARTKAVMDYAGSVVDFTVYLCPYSMGDLT